MVPADARRGLTAPGRFRLRPPVGRSPERRSRKAISGTPSPPFHPRLKGRNHDSLPLRWVQKRTSCSSTAKWARQRPSSKSFSLGAPVALVLLHRVVHRLKETLNNCPVRPERSEAKSKDALFHRESAPQAGIDQRFLNPMVPEFKGLSFPRFHGSFSGGQQAGRQTSWTPMTNGGQLFEVSSEWSRRGDDRYTQPMTVW